LTDERFRESLFTDEENAVRGYALTDADRQALSSVTREAIEEQAQGFGEASATGTRIGITIKTTF
jgi:hypothetical protein